MSGKQKKTLARILITAVIFALLLVLDKTGLPEERAVPRMALFFCFAVPYLIIGYDVILKAFRNIRNGQVFDENFLMMIATFAAFAIGEYAEALAVMLFYQTGELFQSYAVGKSRQSITELMSIAPEYANRVGEDGQITQEDPEDIAVGDVIVVKPGERIPLDGTVTEGESFLDTAALTGESVPRRAHTGDDVISGCVNGEGTLKIRVTKKYEDSTVARILELVENAGNKKARLENFITRFAKYYTPVVTVCALLLALVPPLVLGGAWMEWIKRACVFLIVSCPCALVISVPLGFFGGIGAASRIGVLVKGSNYLEAIAQVTTVVFDKTGTLTKGAFAVSHVYPADDAGGALPADTAEYGTEAWLNDAQKSLLELAAYAECFSNHPIAASVRAAYGKETDAARVSEAKEEAGGGVCVLFDGRELLAGNEKLLSAHHVAVIQNGAVQNETGTVLHVAYDGGYRGAIIVSDSVKQDARTAIEQMKEAGVRHTVMLTGDRKNVAEQVARETGIDSVYAELLPADKVGIVETILVSQEGSGKKTAFAGDGVNDAPVLMRADVGIAMGAIGSDAAIEAADIVLMDDNILKIARVMKIARKTLAIVRQNVVFAIGVKFLVLILGALGFASMWAAVFADVGVAVLAILNSMRMLRDRG